MKIQYMSDLHLEFMRKERKKFIDELPVLGDVLVLAGDISTESKPSLFKRIAKRFEGVPIVYVPGNHEYYGRTREHVDKQLKMISANLENFHVLNPGIVEINGVVFAGATLWFQKTMETMMSKSSFSDFNYIMDAMDTQWMFSAHEQHVKFLRGVVADVVVTHHAPSMKSVHPDFEGSAVNHFFCNPLEDLVDQVGARLWIHGHTHHPMDYILSDTRIVCNPKAYKFELGRFDPTAVIELGRGEDHDHPSFVAQC